MRKSKRLLTLLMALALMLTALAGCSGKNGGENGEGGSGTPNGDKTNPEYVYVADFQDVDNKDMQYFSSTVWYDGKLYVAASYISGKETETDPTTGQSYEYDVYEQGLFVMEDPSAGFTQLTNYKAPEIPEGMEGSSYMQQMCIDKDGYIWVLENLYTYSFDLPEDFDETTDSKWNYYVNGEDTYMIRKLDNTGTEVSSIDTSQLRSSDADYFYVNNMTAGNDGNLYISTGDNFIYVLSPEGDVTKIETEDWIQSFVNLPDGRTAVFTSTWDEAEEKTKSQFTPIDVANKSFGEPVSAPYNAYNFYQGSGDYDIYYQNGDSMYGFNFETEESTKLFSWLSCDVDSNNLSSVTALEDGRFCAISQEWTENGYESEIVTLTKTDASTVQQKTILTYACMYIDYNIRSEIIKFNKSNANYRIEVQDYSEYNTENDYQAGLTKLTTEILSGDVPDILDTDNLPIDRYAAKGLLEDLWPYIEQDTEIGGREGLVEQVFKAMESDGKLYYIVPGFSIQTVVGAPSIVGDKMGWTLDDLMTAYSNMPEGANVFDESTTKDTVMRYCCYSMLGDLVDWETGKCSFDSQEFIDVLNFTQLFPETFDWESYYGDDYVYESEYTKLMSGRQMLSVQYISDFDSIQMLRKMFGGEVTFVGFPTGHGNGSAFNINSGLAMSSTCKNKDGAWEFIRTFLTEDYQTDNVWSFPTNKAAFDAKLTDAMTPIYYTDPVTGEQVEQDRGGWWIGEGEDDVIYIYAMSEEDRDVLMELINSTESIYEYDDTLYQVITEDVAAFYAGQKSAEEVAKLIQSRVSIYVNEQR
ncbi:MAG: extracellular solute-binding protein [Oscillospiraceae bacterium]